MKKLSKAGKLGKMFKKFQGIMLIVIPCYFIIRILLSLIFNI
jgi:hypothetical protein